MVIKNKDGSEYKLSKPNPHMKNQLLWDSFELHNMNFENIKGLIKKNKVEIKEKVEELEELVEQELVEQEEEEVKEVIKEVKEVIKEVVVKEEESSVKKTLIYCLPAKIKFHEDILYGEVKKTINYDKKFKFEAVILNITDVSMDIWTNAIIIEKESILYPQNFDKRWWKVNNISSKFDGNILSCVLSSINPSFEDLQL